MGNFPAKLGGCDLCHCWESRTVSGNAQPGSGRCYATEPESSRCESSEMHDQLSTGLPEAAAQGSKQLMDFLEGPGNAVPSAWTANLDVPLIKARATALEKALDHTLNPLLSQMETYLTKGIEVRWLRHQGTELSGVADITWETATVSDIVSLASVAVADLDPPSLSDLGHRVSSMLALLHAICLAGERMEMRVPPPLFEVSCVNRLVRMVASVTSTSTAAMTQEQGAAQWTSFCDLADRLGLLPQERLAVVLSPQSKCFMVHLQGIATFGVRSLAIQVARDTTFQDGMEQVLREDVMDEAVPCVLTPTFTLPDQTIKEKIRCGLPMNGIDGIRTEFFLGSGLGMVDVQPGGQQATSTQRLSLFTFNSCAGKFWFNTALDHTPASEAQYTYAGWLMGQLFANRASLGIPLPEVLFEKLLNGTTFRASLEALSEFDTEAAAMVRNVSYLSEEEYQRLLEAEGHAPITSRSSFQRKLVRQILTHSVAWQFTALSKGFFKAVDRDTLQRWRITPGDMVEIVEGMVCPAHWQRCREGKAKLADSQVVMVEACPPPFLYRDKAITLRKLAINTTSRLAALRDGKQPYTPPAKAEMLKPNQLVSFLSVVPVRNNKVA